jgi:hypothetical protein
MALYAVAQHVTTLCCERYIATADCMGSKDAATEGRVWVSQLHGA